MVPAGSSSGGTGDSGAAGVEGPAGSVSGTGGSGAASAGSRPSAAPSATALCTLLPNLASSRSTAPPIAAPPDSVTRPVDSDSAVIDHHEPLPLADATAESNTALDRPA